MSEEELNPYAPPASGGQDPAYGGGGWGDDRGLNPRAGVDYEAERQSVLLCIALTVVTCGLYPMYWMFRRKPFLDSLRSNEKLGSLPMLMVGTAVLSLVGVFDEKLGQILSLPNAIVGLVAIFRVRTILERERIAMGAPTRLSVAATFFFTIYYLQYRINRLADVARGAEPRRPKRKKKKAAKKKARAKLTPEPAVDGRPPEPG